MGEVFPWEYILICTCSLNLSVRGYCFELHDIVTFCDCVYAVELGMQYSHIFGDSTIMIKMKLVTVD